jgi:Fuc2NAc and GlcNAc transferase
MNDLCVWMAPLIAAVAAVILTPMLRRWLLHCNLVDLPGERRSHSMPTPRGGGLAVIVAMILAIVVCGPVWWSGLFLLGLLGMLGWVEDRHEIDPAIRLMAQGVFAVLALWLIGGVATVDILGYTVRVPWLWTLLSGIAVVWLINLHNFMDGSDGLAAMQGIWSGLAMGLLMVHDGLVAPAVLALAMAGGFAGFLVWNCPPARIFMGDAGSLALGGGVAILALIGAASGAVSVWVSLIVTSLFVVDATATLVMRVIQGEQWYTAHRQHAYQCLITAGWGHGHVLTLYAAINLLVVLPVAILATAHPHLEAVLAFALAGLLAGGWWVIQSATTTENQRHE